MQKLIASFVFLGILYESKSLLLASGSPLMLMIASSFSTTPIDYLKNWNFSLKICVTKQSTFAKSTLPLAIISQDRSMFCLT